MRFAVFVLLVALCGWWLENVVGPWAQTRILQGRLRRELEQQRQLRQVFEGEFEDVTAQPVRCICEWFDHDTVIVNPACKASDHGRVEELRRSFHIVPTTPYRFRKE